VKPQRVEWDTLWIRTATQRNLHEASQIVDKLMYAKLTVHRTFSNTIRGTRVVRVYVLKGQVANARRVCGLLPVGGKDFG
jgi:hypothetical protein